MRPSVPVYSMHVRGGSTSWVLPEAIVDLDFVNQRYFFGGSLKQINSFATFSGGTFSSGLVLDGTGGHDISISYAALGLSVPFSFHASLTPAAVGAVQPAAVFEIDANNFTSVGFNAANGSRFYVWTGSILQANITTAAAASIGVRATVGGLFQSNNAIASLNGATSGTQDVGVTVFVPTVLRIGEQSAATVNGTIRRITAFSGTKSQAQLNAETALVHAT